MSNSVLDDGEEIEHLREKGWTWEQVAGELGYTKPVAQRLAKNFRDAVAERIRRDQLALF